MSTQSLPPQPRARTQQSPVSLGTIVLGGILVLIGLAWILDLLDVVNLTLGTILPAALVLVGLALLAGSMTGSHGGLVALGVVLTVILTFATSVNVPLSGGIGDRTYSPTQVSDLPDRYQLPIGNLTVDLTSLSLPPGETTVNARVGFGQLTVSVPRGVGVLVHWKVSGGNVDVLGESQNGTSLDDQARTSNYDSTATKLVIEASVGFGDIKVRQP